MTDDLPLLETLLGEQSHRLRGIPSWDLAPHLGRSSLQRLIQLAQDNVNSLLTADAPRQELRDLRRGIEYLQSILPAATAKPLLPRLRAENILLGDEVCLYVRDSEGCIAPTDWVRATITDRQKGYNAAWADGTPNSGYHWRLTATADLPIFPHERAVAFSTSEPRALPIAEYDYLRRADQEDRAFLEVFCANAWRPWCPIWCLERGAACAGETMDMKNWLLVGSAPADG
jgi:hypothetical protein